MTCRIRGLALLGMVALFSGCFLSVSSIHPLWSPDKGIFLNDLLGTWRGEYGLIRGGDELGDMVFDRDVDVHGWDSGRYVGSISDRYTVTWQADETLLEIRFLARVVQLGDIYFLDMVPSFAGCVSQDDEYTKMLFYYLLSSYPTHIISKLEIDADTLRMSNLNAAWFEHKLDTEELSIPYIPYDFEAPFVAQDRRQDEGSLTSVSVEELLQKSLEERNEMAVSFVQEMQNDMGVLFLIADTEELQEFILAHLEDEGFFEDDKLMIKVVE